MVVIASQKQPPKRGRRQNGPRPSRNVHFAKMLISQVLKMPETNYGIPRKNTARVGKSPKSKTKQSKKRQRQGERERDREWETEKTHMNIKKQSKTHAEGWQSKYLMLHLKMYRNGNGNGKSNIYSTVHEYIYKFRI